MSKVKMTTWIVALLCPCILMAQENNDVDVLKSIDAYEQASKGERLALANSMMKDYALLADSLYVFDSKTEDAYRDGWVYYWSAYYLWDQGDNTNALMLNEKAIHLLQKTDSIPAYSDCLALTTIIYTRLSDFVTAARYAQMTLELDRQTGDEKNISSSLNTIAAIWSGANQYEKAEKYIREATDLERRLERPNILAIRLGLGSEILLKANKNEEALQWAKEALEVEPNEVRIPVRQSQLGAVLAQMQRNDEARDMLLKAKQGLEASGNINSLCITLRQLAELAAKEGHTAEATAYMDQGLEICKKTRNSMLESQICKLYAKVLSPTQPQLAMGYLERYSQLNDTLFNNKLAEQLQLFNVKYDTAEKQHQLDIQGEQIARNRLLIILLAVVAVVIVVIAILLLRLARARGRANGILIKANMAKDELLRIANEEKLHAESARQQMLAVAERINNIGEMPDVKLTKREVQLIQLFCQGLLSKEIADQLDISIRTVETHKAHIYKKIGINNSVELVQFAKHQGLV